MLNTFIDLFSGMGGFRIALEAQGLECLYSCEIDNVARRVYQQNFGSPVSEDITKVRTELVPEHDVLCAGFPCQPFSVAGKRKGQDDDRAGLFQHILRIIDHHQPKVLFFENVPHLLKIDNGETYKDICASIRERGYDLKVENLNAARYGIPQARKRLYFIAIRQNLPLIFHVPEEANYPTAIRDILGIPGYHNTPGYYRKDEKPKMEVWDEDEPQGDLYAAHKVGNVWHMGRRGTQGGAIYHSARPVATITSSANDFAVFHDGKVRPFSFREMQRLCGIPTSFKMDVSYSGGIVLMGNAVIPRMVSTIFNSIQLKGRQTRLFE